VIRIGRTLISALFVLTTATVWAQRDLHVPDVHFITTDIDAFWTAFDIFKNDSTTNPFGTYLRNGSDGLKDFAEHRIKDSASFLQVIKKELAYYENLRNTRYQMLEYKDVLKQYFKNFKSIYPQAEFPKIYFVMGQLNTGATNSNSAIIVGWDLFSDPGNKLSNGKSGINFDRLPIIIAGALAYHNQKPAYTGYTVLRQCVVMGTADFIASLIVGNDKHLIFEQPNYLYGEQHEQELVSQFLREKDSDDLSQWLYDPNPSGPRPPDLGFWIGYKIAEAYYNNSPDKVKAIDELMKINDFEKFLLLSGYTEPFRN
jgi:hypothetical protein